MLSPSRSLGLILGLIAVAIFGGSLPATRAAVAGGLDPWFVTAGRAGIGGVIAIVLLVAGRVPFPRERLGTLVLISLCLVIGFPGALAFASLTVPSAHGGVVLGFLPLASAIAAAPLAGERPSPVFWLLSLLGAGLVTAFALRDGSHGIVTGDIMLACAVALTGIGYSLSAMMTRSLAGWQVIAWALVLAFPLAVIVCVVLWPPHLAAVPWSAWTGLAYSGVMAQFVAYIFWNQAMALGGVARIGQLQLLQPFVTFAIAAVLLGERVDAEMVAFAVAVMVVVALGRRAAVTVRAS